MGVVEEAVAMVTRGTTNTESVVCVRHCFQKSMYNNY